jgi:hypothetical protein
MTRDPDDPTDTGDDERYPNGVLSRDDGGALWLRLGIHNGAVVIDFGKAVKWIGFDPEHALDVAANLVKLATSLKDSAPKADTEKMKADRDAMVRVLRWLATETEHAEEAPSSHELHALAERIERGEFMP